MADELQAAITGATPDAMETLKTDLGLNDKAETTTRTPEPKKEAAPKTEVESEPEEVDTDQDTTEGEDDNTEGKAEKAESKKLSPLELKIKRQAAANHRQTETINELKTRLAELEKQKTSEVKQAEASGPVKPKMEDFDDYEDYNKAITEYTEAMVEYKAEQKFKAQHEAAQRERMQKEQEEKLTKIADAFTSREEKFKATHKNYERNAQALLETFELLPPENQQGLGILRQYLANSEVGPNMIHHLGANPELIEDITEKSDFFEVARSIIELENSVKGSNGSKKLPEPIGEMPRNNSGTKTLVDMDWNELKKQNPNLAN